MQRQFQAVGLSFKNTPLEVREAVAFDEVQSKQFMNQLKEVLGIDEMLVLSTCNRTEVYYTAPADISGEVAKMIDVFHGLGDRPAHTYFQAFDHDAAVRHLFEVSLGVDAMVLGDIQISNQVKKAYQWAADENMAGPFLHRLMHTVFFTNKRMIQETSFRDGTASVASAAVETAEKFMANYIMPKIAVIGLGEIGENVAENLRDLNAEITLVNRTLEKAEQKARELGYLVAPFEELNRVVAESNVVISAVQAPAPVITEQMLAANEYPKMLIDLSIPRSIEETVENCVGVLLYNVDHLKAKASDALKRREAALPAVHSIIDEGVYDYQNWSQEMEVSPTIKKLKDTLEEIRKQEIARYLDKVGEKEAKILEQATKSMIQKVIKLPVLQLKAACKRGEAETLVDVLNDLFNLEGEETKSLK